MPRPLGMTIPPGLINSSAATLPVLANSAVGSLTYKIADLFGCKEDVFMKSFCKPKIKVGTEWVTKGPIYPLTPSGLGGFARATSHRLYKWIIIKCNYTPIDKSTYNNDICLNVLPIMVTGSITSLLLSICSSKKVFMINLGWIIT